MIEPYLHFMVKETSIGKVKGFAQVTWYVGDRVVTKTQSLDLRLVTPLFIWEPSGLFKNKNKKPEPLRIKSPHTCRTSETRQGRNLLLYP